MLRDSLVSHQCKHFISRHTYSQTRICRLLFVVYIFLIDPENYYQTDRYAKLRSVRASLLSRIKYIAFSRPRNFNLGNILILTSDAFVKFAIIFIFSDTLNVCEVINQKLRKSFIQCQSYNGNLIDGLFSNPYCWNILINWTLNNFKM